LEGSTQNDEEEKKIVKKKEVKGKKKGLIDEMYKNFHY